MAKNVIELGNRGIVYEDYTNFANSIFEGVYKKAEEYVCEIVNSNIELEQLKRHGNDFRNKEQVDNIIAFIGRRGTGKTSSMLSFMEGLKDHNKNGKKTLKQDRENEWRFIGLEWIEASLLEKNQDIFEMILIKMFGEFQKKAREIYGRGKSTLDEKNKDLYQKFEGVYRQILQLKNKNAVYETDSVLTVLRDLSRGSTVREEFADLIKAYVSFIDDVNNREFGKTKTYLVVAIDDIDVNLKSGYEILEQVHRYLMVPGLIVLTAINLEEMLLCCQKQYVDDYWKLKKISKGLELEKRAKKMSEEYLEKILPPYRRVYLPSLKKQDYFLDNKKKVKIDRTEYDSIKEGMFHLIQKRTGVFYDALGKKRHFIESVTLRRLDTNYELYRGMEALPKKTKKDYLQIYDENYHKVLDDILFRFAIEGLPEKEYKILMDWSKEDVLRRGEEIVEDVTSVAEYLSDRQQKYIPIVKDYKNFGYSYGQLLRSLYLMGRMWDYHPESGRKRIYNKKLVHILLKQYTVTLSWIFEHYLLEEDEKKPKYRNMLNELLNGSIVGSWGKEIGPKIGRIGQENQTKQIEDSCLGAVQGIKLTDLFLYRGKKDDSLESLCKKWSWEDCENFMAAEEFQSIIITIFFLQNIVECPAGLNGSYSFFIKSKDKGADEEISSISLNGGRADYDIFNFVNDSFHYREVLKGIYIAFTEAVFDKSENKGGFARDSIKNQVEIFMQKQENCEESILNKFIEWEKESGGFAIPVYNMDITYNLIKRLIYKYDYGVTDKKIEPSEVYKIIKNIFKKIKEELKKQDSYYKKDCQSHFADYFEKCPIIQCILKDNENKYQNSFLHFFEGEHSQAPAEALEANSEE